MKLFELEASIKLDSTAFSTDLNNAVSDAQTLASEIDDLNTAPETTGKTSLTNVLGDSAKLSNQIGEAKKKAVDTEDQINTLKEKGSDTLTGLLNVFTFVAATVVEHAVDAIFDVGAESIEMAAAEDSPLAKAYKNATENLSLTQDMAKLQIGNALLPAVTSFKNAVDDFVSSLFGFGQADKILYFFDQIEKYRADNLATVTENIKSVFGAFDQYTAPENAVSLSDMTQAVQSQTAYWQEYAEIMASLKSKGVDSKYLAEYADGSIDSLSYLKAMDQASPEGLAAFIESVAGLSDAQSVAATAINDAQVDAYIGSEAMLETYQTLIDGLDQEEAARLAASATVGSVIDVLSQAYPSFSNWIDMFKSKMAELGTELPSSVNENLFNWRPDKTGQISGRPSASGIGYVPYDGYRAELHRGETVLTRQQAEEYRSGDKHTPGIDTGELKQVIAAALNEWLSPVGEDQIVGVVNRGIGQSMRGRR